MNPTVKINGGITVEDALYGTVPQGFGNYSGMGVVPVSTDAQEASADGKTVVMSNGIKFTVLTGGAAGLDDEVKKKGEDEQSEEERILARRRAMIAIQTEGLGVAL